MFKAVSSAYIRTRDFAFLCVWVCGVWGCVGVCVGGCVGEVGVCGCVCVFERT